MIMGKKLILSSTPRDLEVRAKKDSAIIRAFKMLNFWRPMKWTVERTIFEGQENWAFSSGRTSTEEMDQLLSGQVPELFAGSGIRFASSGRVWLFKKDGGDSWKRNALEHDLHDQGSHPSSIFVEILGLPVPAKFEQRLREYVENFTWLGGRIQAAESVYVSVISPLGRKFRLAPRLIKGTEETLVVNDPSGTWMVEARPGRPRARVRHAVWGFTSEVSLRRDWQRLSEKYGCEITIEVSSTTFGATSSTAFQDEEWSRVALSVADEAFEAIVRSRDFRAFSERCKLQLLTQQAQKLNARKERVAHRPWVLYKNRRLCLVPVGETELVALYFRLEELGVIPFASCNVYEYTPREGIDALANLQISADHLRDEAAPVEFELTLDNFFLHEHPTQHVRLIICWSANADSLPEGFSLVQFHPALPGCVKRLSGADHGLPVLVVSELPFISMSE